MTMPNFLIIGAQKAGTTSLYFYLKRHPQIYMSADKEPHFFAYRGGIPKFRGPLASGSKYWRTRTTSLEAYERLFDGVTTEKAIGEASTYYLCVPETARAIRHHIPDVKLIAILRNPVDRAFSNFRHCVKLGFEPLINFQEALQEEDKRMRDNWGIEWYYRQKSLYYNQMKRYYDTFDRNQIKTYLTEDLAADPIAVLRDIFRFLNVDDSFVPEISSKFNVSRGIPGNRVLQSLLMGSRQIIAPFRFIIPDSIWSLIIKSIKKRYFVVPVLEEKTRAELIKYFKKDILRLQDLIQRDLSGWLE